MLSPSRRLLSNGTIDDCIFLIWAFFFICLGLISRMRSSGFSLQFLFLMDYHPSWMISRSLCRGPPWKMSIFTALSMDRLSPELRTEPSLWLYCDAKCRNFPTKSFLSFTAMTCFSFISSAFRFRCFELISNAYCCVRMLKPTSVPTPYEELRWMPPSRALASVLAVVSPIPMPCVVKMF